MGCCAELGAIVHGWRIERIWPSKGSLRVPWLVGLRGYPGWWLVVLPASPRVRLDIPLFWVRFVIFMDCCAELCRIVHGWSIERVWPSKANSEFLAGEFQVGSMETRRLFSIPGEHEVSTYPLFQYPPYCLALASRMAEVAESYDLDLLHVHYAIPHFLRDEFRAGSMETRRLFSIPGEHATMREPASKSRKPFRNWAMFRDYPCDRRLGPLPMGGRQILLYPSGVP
jgi:hypothetical protein